MAALLYVCINTLATLSPPGMRLDVTEDGLYTLSEGTLATLAQIDEAIELSFFLSDRLEREVPQFAAYGRRVRDTLEEIAAASGGGILLQQYSPQPFSDVEDLAVALGLQGIPLDQGSALAYFGLAGSNTTDDEEVISFFQPEREALLEYDLAQMIHALSNPEAVVVGIMGSLPIMGNMQAHMQGGVLVPWPIANRLKASVSLINLPEILDAVPPEVDVVLVVHPRAMTERAIYALEQFLFRGGRAMFFLDPKAETDPTTNPDTASSSVSGLDPLLPHWGILVPDGLLVGDKSMALRINAGTADRPVPAEYLAWLGVKGGALAAEDPITSQLPTMNLPSAGFIQSSPNAQVKLSPLIQSSANSAAIEVADLAGLRPDILGVLERFEPDGET